MKPTTNGLPSSPEAESAILGAILRDDQMLRQVQAAIGEEDFEGEKHRRIYRAMLKLADGGYRVDLVTVTEILIAAQQLDSVGGMSYLGDLDDGLGSIMGIDTWLRIVKDKSILRRYVLGHQRLIDEALMYGDTAEVLERAERFNRELAVESTGGHQLLSAGEIIREQGGIDQFFESVQTQGIPAPWPRVNYFIGWRKKELTLIAARPAVGKTAVALQIAHHAAKHGTAVALFSLEMAAAELLFRLICTLAHVDSHRYRRGQCDSEELRRLATATGEVNDLPIRFDDHTGCTVPALYSSLRRLSAREPVGLVIIDYLQLMSAGRRQNRNEEVSTISRGLKLLATDFDIPLIVLSQLTRGPEHEGRRPRLSDLRDSGSLEQDANNVIFLHAKDKNYGACRAIELIIAKQRNGRVGQCNMIFRADICRLEEELPEENTHD